MKTITTLIFSLLFQVIVSAQDKVSKDIDNDGITDVVYINSTSSAVVCKLSTKKFRETASKPMEILAGSTVKGTKNGFEFFSDYTRAGYTNQFRYNPKTKKIQLIGMRMYSYHGMDIFEKGDCDTESSINLLTGDYIGNWEYYNTEKSRTIKIPAIKTNMYFDTINLEEFGEDVFFDYAQKCDELYKAHTYNIKQQ